MKAVPGIIVIYESPYRIKKLLKVLAEEFPENRIIIGREMTKIYEEYLTGTCRELHDKAGTITEKGEFTVAVENRHG